jgi:hypothetical protein
MRVVVHGLATVVTLSQRNLRELYHLEQAAQAQGMSDLPYLIKNDGKGGQLIVQIERDDVHYGNPNSDYDGHPDAVPV